MIIRGLIIAYVMIDVGQDLLRQHLTNTLKEGGLEWLNTWLNQFNKEKYLRCGKWDLKEAKENLISSTSFVLSMFPIIFLSC